MQNAQVEKPEKRGRLRKFLGTEYFIAKRKLIWLKNNKSYARVGTTEIKPEHLLITHKSLLLRPLKDVDMRLQYNKIVNLGIAIKRINSVVIQPGETFSLWRLVGRPTQSKGYLEGLVLHNGQTSTGIGGGLCQLGNLLYWMVLHTPLSITERWRHSYDVFPDVNRTIPFGCGATLSYNYVDLQLQNNTDKAFQINLWLDDKYLNGEIRCTEKLPLKYEIFESDHIFSQQWWGGYTRHNKIWKKITDELTGEVTEELVTQNHAIMMYNPYLTQGKN